MSIKKQKHMPLIWLHEIPPFPRFSCFGHPHTFREEKIFAQCQRLKDYRRVMELVTEVRRSHGEAIAEMGTLRSLYQWIGLRENLQENTMFNIV